MYRFIPAFLAGIVVFAATARADAPAGNWKLAINGGQIIFLIKLEEKDGKWSGQMLEASDPGVPKVTIADVIVTPDRLRYTMRIQNQELAFDGKLPPDPKTGKLSGSLQIRPGQMILLQMDPTKLKNFDKFEFAKERIEQSTDGQEVADAATDLLRLAGEKKVKIEEVRGWADKANKMAGGYGPRWQRHVTMRLAKGLIAQKEFAPLAVEYARKAERLLDDSDDVTTQMQVLELVVQVLLQSGKAGDATDLQTRLAKLEEKDYPEYVKKAPFKPELFEGRKGKSDRAVLVELFTGAECPPCVAADIAFDALDKTFKRTEVILLQYHVHIPGPDPLANAETMARLEYYGKKVEGAPAVMFNGKAGASSGGPAQAGRKKYAEFRDAIEPQLEKEAGAKIELTATRKGSEIAIKANVSDAIKTGETIRLRFMLVEERVRYSGSNGQRYHHYVVRNFPGGVRGVALTKKSLEQTATVNLDELRTKLNQYLDDFAKNEVEFPSPNRPMDMKNLHVVAVVQDDESNDILQAAEVAVK
jgi:hypothetical protein